MVKLFPESFGVFDADPPPPESNLTERAQYLSNADGPTPRHSRFVVGDMLSDDSVVSAIQWSPENNDNWVSTQFSNGEPHSGMTEKSFVGIAVVSTAKPAKPAAGDTVRLTITKVYEGVVKKWLDGALHMDGHVLDGTDRTDRIVEILKRAELTRAELIAEARAYVPPRFMPETSVLIARLADALEQGEK